MALMSSKQNAKDNVWRTVERWTGATYVSQVVNEIEDLPVLDGEFV